MNIQSYSEVHWEKVQYPAKVEKEKEKVSQSRVEFYPPPPSPSVPLPEQINTSLI